MDYHRQRSKELGFPKIYGFANIIAVLGGALSFLLVFRLNWSYTHWWEARGAFGAYTSKIRDVLLTTVSNYDRLSFSSIEEREKARKVLEQMKCTLKLHASAVADELCHGPLANCSDDTFHVSPKMISDESWFHEHLSEEELKIVGLTRVQDYVRTPYRVLLCHKWLTNDVNEAAACGLFQNFEELMGHQQLASMLDLYYTLVKIKMTAMPSVQLSRGDVISRHSFS